jgi:hypothetical protein
VWWFIPVILTFQKLKQKDPKFEVSLGTIPRVYLKRGTIPYMIEVLYSYILNTFGKRVEDRGKFVEYNTECLH